MAGRLLLLFVIVPVCELGILIKLTELTSVVTTVAIVIATGIAGMSLVRWQGASAWREIRQQLGRGQSPSLSIVAGVLVLIAGAFLLTPGLLTDSAGFLLLVPAVRRRIAGYLQRRFADNVKFTFQSGSFGTAQWTSAGMASSASDAPDERPQVRVVDPTRKIDQLPDDESL